ncbi:hypothetical protein, partial [Acidocella sp.]|uniref:hypothetical protein n=1 Tax=Acidocella sp. TaxID=50710 RepID=UPI002619377B
MSCLACATSSGVCGFLARFGVERAVVLLGLRARDDGVDDVADRDSLRDRDGLRDWGGVRSSRAFVAWCLRFFDPLGRPGLRFVGMMAHFARGLVMRTAPRPMSRASMP